MNNAQDKLVERCVNLLRVFVVHDDPNREVGPDERWWIAVWAENERQAFSLAASHYSGDGPLTLGETPLDEFFAVESEIDPSSWPDRLIASCPCRIRDCESLRLCGFREDDEEECESCGLYAMGMKDYYVCPDCRICADVADVNAPIDWCIKDVIAW